MRLVFSVIDVCNSGYLQDGRAVYGACIDGRTTIEALVDGLTADVWATDPLRFMEPRDGGAQETHSEETPLEDGMDRRDYLRAAILEGLLDYFTPTGKPRTMKRIADRSLEIPGEDEEWNVYCYGRFTLEE